MNGIADQQAVGFGFLAMFAEDMYAPHAGQIAYAAQPEMRCPLPDDRGAVPTGSDGEWPLPDARRNKSGCSEG